VGIHTFFGDCRHPKVGSDLKGDLIHLRLTWSVSATYGPMNPSTRVIRWNIAKLGSAMADILVASVWNRVLITDLGASATPVSLLLGLRYLLAPISIWTGLQSDTRPIFGLRRAPYIWLGRLLMLAGILLLPVSTGRLAVNVNDPIGWGLALAIFVFYGLGTAISGGPFLALVHDSAPAAKRGLAISLAQIILIVGFAVSPIVFARWLPTFSAAGFQSLSVATAGIAGVIWLISILGQDRRAAPLAQAAPRHADTLQMLRLMWADARTRRFFFWRSAR